ncbi:hypothetical protein OG215_40245 (plasmid) [Streptomyces globisporus]|uniref:hypothetical protein n=1 Tax=Streptomyces globisporus TaxID=1908 RepID=UPI002F90A987|nr:hypothetical protein OG215_40245 [Streptomyces globisporus]
MPSSAAPPAASTPTGPTPYPLSTAATELLEQRQGSYAPADADRFLTRTAVTAPADRPRAALPNTVAPVLPDTIQVVLDEALSAVRRIDEATVQVMRERRPKS